jgi:hypothetical protein
MILFVIFIIFCLFHRIFVKDNLILFEGFYLEVKLYFRIFKDHSKRNTIFIKIYINVELLLFLNFMKYLLIFVV